MSTMVPLKEHKEHLARAMNAFEDQHGSEYHWDKYECECHDRLIACVNREDGYPEEDK